MILSISEAVLKIKKTKLKKHKYRNWQIAASKQKGEDSIETLRRKWNPTLHVYKKPEQMNIVLVCNMS